MLPGGPAGAPSDTGLTGLGGVTDEFLALAEAIPGQPGDDYPVFSQPPDTSFTCGDKIEVGVMWGLMTGSVMTKKYIIFRVTTAIPKLNVRVFIFVQMTVLVDFSSTHSFAQTGPSSISNTSSVTGGSMWTVHW